MKDRFALVGYYAAFAFRKVMKAPLLSALTVISISVAVAATMAMVAVLFVISNDPIPSKSDSLYWVQLHPGPDDHRDSYPGIGLTWLDANNLLAAHQANNQAANAPGRLLWRPETKDSPRYVKGQYVTSEFFPMFDTPFVAGMGWSAQEDRNRAHVVVLNRKLAVRVFGSAEKAVGNWINLHGKVFMVTGVLDGWNPSPAFYVRTSGDWAFSYDDEFFLPLHTAMDQKLPVGGGEVSWGDGGKLGDNTAWLQFWIELKDEAARKVYLEFLHDYWKEQSALGRFILDIPPSLITLMDKLKLMGVVPSSVKVQSVLALIFYLVCLFNACGITFAKLYSRHKEVSIRRAMGASFTDIIIQFGVESLLIGLLGGVLGLLLTAGGIWLIHQQPYHYVKFVRMDWMLVVILLLVAVVTSMLVALLPAIRSFRAAPATSLN